MGKKTVLNNDYCEMLNDGFGCSGIAERSAHHCASCLAFVLKGIVEDLAKLTDEAEDDFFKDE